MNLFQQYVQLPHPQVPFLIVDQVVAAKRVTEFAAVRGFWQNRDFRILRKAGDFPFFDSMGNSIGIGFHPGKLGVDIPPRLVDVALARPNYGIRMLVPIQQSARAGKYDRPIPFHVQFRTPFL